MNIDAYLARIGLDDHPSATLEGLGRLHAAHLMAIPYENLDVQLGRPLTTDVAEAYDKIVARRRGGWCYEMNGLFGWALREFGFDVSRGTGAVARELVGDAQIGNHLVLRVRLPEGVWLADVGFGNGPRDAVPVKVGAFESGGFTFAVQKLDRDWWRFVNDPRIGTPSFDFHLAAADEAVLTGQCQYLQSSPQSPFTQNLVVQRHIPGGLSILRGRVLKTITPGSADERVLTSAAQLVTTLKTDFALDVPEAAALWDQICARHDELMAKKQEASPQPSAA